MPRRLIGCSLIAALLAQGCAGVSSGTLTARGVSAPLDVREPSSTLPDSSEGTIDLWREPPASETQLLDPADLAKKATQPEDPTLREWLNDHPIAKAGLAIGIMTVATSVALVTTFMFDDTTKKKK
jgi:hypothetical protein